MITIDSATDTAALMKSAGPGLAMRSGSALSALRIETITATHAAQRLLSHRPTAAGQVLDKHDISIYYT